MYVELLKKYKEKYGYKLFSFCLLPNQINLLFELQEGSTISMVMHDITSSYTKYFNSRYDRKGHLFRERFKSTVVEKEPYILSLIHFIHTRPVRFGLAGEPLEYTFSSALLYAGAPEEKLQKIKNILTLSEEIQEVAEVIGRLLPEKKTYAEFVAAVTKEEMDNLNKKLSRGGILGSSEFIESVKEKMRKKEVQPPDEKKSIALPIMIFTASILVAGAVVASVYFVKQAEIEKKRSIEREVKQKVMEIVFPLVELDGTEWVVELRAQGEVKSDYPLYDKVTFKDGTITSQYFTSRGFPGSNYALNTKNDGTHSWETMQRNAKNELIFWKGEATKEGIMSGEFGIQHQDGSVEEFSFTSIGYKREEKK